MLLLFILMSLASLLWFAWSILSLIGQINSNSPAISFDKGAMYMLGVGVGLSALTYAILHEAILKKILTERVTSWITRCAFAGIGLMFIFPHIVHYPVENYLEGEGYQICSQASYQWLLYRKIVYVSSPEVCAGLGRKKK
jgi:hypothetical protein